MVAGAINRTHISQIKHRSLAHRLHAYLAVLVNPFFWAMGSWAFQLATRQKAISGLQGLGFTGLGLKAQGLKFRVEGLRREGGGWSFWQQQQSTVGIVPYDLGWKVLGDTASAPCVFWKGTYRRCSRTSPTETTIQHFQKARIVPLQFP